MLLPREVWKDIPSYEGLYQVSNIGNVRSLNYRQTSEVKRMKAYTNKIGYKVIYLWKDGKRKGYKVHRLVAEAFIPNPNNYKEVNHIDENKANNCVWNLEWCDRKYNVNYGARNEKAGKNISKALKDRPLSEEHKARLSESHKGKSNIKISRKIRCIELNIIFPSIREANIYFNKSEDSSNIQKAIKRNGTCCGYHWEYAD